ncbi:hypothetical protein ABW20_dc0110409 [Dactylellina cionopaga]|nr:hypothetical protein ABW20_dc0110409 [Dactylellina cionopaga]
MPPLVTNLSKPATVPSLTGAALWADETNQKLYLYGGKFTIGQTVPFQLWIYDALYDNWYPANSSSSNLDVSRIYNGASTVAEDQALGFYLGGWIGEDSEYGWQGDDVAVSNLLIYDMLENAWRNISGPDNTPRAEGVMLYLPIGDNGMLVAFGGISIPNGDPRNITGIPMSEISLYDIGGNNWYTQTARGQVPQSRRLFCAGMASAEDGSSHNIYLYGGASTPSSSGSHPNGFDDVYILSIPSFVWTKYWPSDNENSRPHNMLSCNAIHGSQMLIIGGYFPGDAPNECDVIDQAGVHNLDLSGVNGTLWKTFEPSKTEYSLPTTVAAEINRITPAPTSYDYQDLSVLLTRTPKPTSRTPTRSLVTATSSPNAGALSARSRNIVIGVVVPVAIIFIGIGIFIFLRWRRNSARDQTLYSSTGKPAPPPADIADESAGGGANDRKYTATASDFPELNTYAQSDVSAPYSPPPPSILPHLPPPPPPPVPLGPSAPIAYVRDHLTGGLIPVYDHDAGTATPPRVLSPRLNPLSPVSSRLSTHEQEPAGELEGQAGGTFYELAGSDAGFAHKSPRI